MSFNINLYTCNSAANVVNKEINQITTTTGTLRSGCSITDPVVKIEFDEADVWRRGFNYFYIEPFQRFYYVTNMIAIPGNTELSQMFEVHGHVDVLMSFAEQIKAQTGVVARQERTYNLMLDDGFFMAYQNPQIQTLLFSNATPFETQEFVLVVAGNDSGS